MTESGGRTGLSAETQTVLDVLERNRRTFAWKTGGLDRAGLAATMAATSMTLGGLVKHMALVETDWLVVKLAGQPYGRAASVREMLLDMIEEYARHTGHADLLRESVDGLTGEGAPGDFQL
jgi:Protein of unknown function (DUF664)